MTAILALDQGTSSTRAIVFDLNGKILALAQEPLEQHYPQNAWVEHDAVDIWQAQLRTAQSAIHQAQTTIQAIGITNQRETVVIWDRKTGIPIHRALVWQDRRTADQCQLLKEQGHSEFIYEKTGLVLDPYFSASKISWILDQVPGARQRAASGALACGTIDTWLLWNLSEGRQHITDVSNAARTSLMNIQSATWDKDLLALFAIPEQILPEIRSSAEIYDQCTLFGTPIPIAGIAGDQQAALFGQQCIHPGMVKCTYGTGAFIMMQCGTQRKDTAGLLSTVAWKIGNADLNYAIEGSVFSAGSAVQWLRDGLGIIQSATEIEALAQAVNDSGDVYFVPGFTGLGTPYWDPDARGSIIGLHRGTNKKHIARACLEGIAHQVCDVLDAMQKAGEIDVLRVDGGAAMNDLLLRIQADFAHIQIERPYQIESTALGAAYLAAIGAGLCTESEIQSATDLCIEPKMPQPQRISLRKRWDQAVRRSLQWAHDAS